MVYHLEKKIHSPGFSQVGGVIINSYKYRLLYDCASANILNRACMSLGIIMLSFFSSVCFVVSVSTLGRSTTSWVNTGSPLLGVCLFLCPLGAAALSVEAVSKRRFCVLSEGIKKKNCPAVVAATAQLP